ncbi:MAG: hypothetical protein QF599_03605 [Planctomycetota bacterium]|jgi:tetrahydromethanopterin S-methyltransferase subunit E|nr:hypothetical protein [Planctomycetota bacterium]MDP6740313.1 hypothetical protein [Planctomycetota bacterium]MDP6955039.1 hypothetical protein [Planctomycetota bacterium]
MSAIECNDDAGTVKRLFALALACLVGSCVAGAWAVCMVTWTLPETDSAHGQPPFASPFVSTVAAPFIGGAWLLTFGASALMLRRAPVGASFAICLAVALVTITVATPFLGFPGALLSVPVTLGVIVWRGRKSGAALTE